MEGSIADKKYIAFTSAMFASSIADIELTQRCQEIGQCSYAPSSLRSRTAMYGIGMPADLAIAYFSYHLKKHHNSLWYLPSAAVTLANAYVGMHAYHRSQE